MHQWLDPHNPLLMLLKGSSLVCPLSPLRTETTAWPPLSSRHWAVLPALPMLLPCPHSRLEPPRGARTGNGLCLTLRLTKGPSGSCGDGPGAGPVKAGPVQAALTAQGPTSWDQSWASPANDEPGSPEKLLVDCIQALPARSSLPSLANVPEPPLSLPFNTPASPHPSLHHFTAGGYSSDLPPGSIQPPFRVAGTRPEKACPAFPLPNSRDGPLHLTEQDRAPEGASQPMSLTFYSP